MHKGDAVRSICTMISKSQSIHLFGCKPAPPFALTAIQIHARAFSTLKTCPSGQMTRLPGCLHSPAALEACRLAIGQLIHFLRFCTDASESVSAVLCTPTFVWLPVHPWAGLSWASAAFPSSEDGHASRHGLRRCSHSRLSESVCAR